ncbi:hypothetical protein SEVIR_5G054001v4 [Setaria viridis]
MIFRLTENASPYDRAAQTLTGRRDLTNPNGTNHAPKPHRSHPKSSTTAATRAPRSSPKPAPPSPRTPRAEEPQHKQTHRTYRTPTSTRGTDKSRRGRGRAHLSGAPEAPRPIGPDRRPAAPRGRLRRRRPGRRTADSSRRATTPRANGERVKAAAAAGLLLGTGEWRACHSSAR